jgi:hypothetical protein
MRALVCTAALCLTAAPAFADAPQAALDLIAGASAQGVFEAAPSEPGAIIVRHPRSGLTCRLGSGASNRLLVFPQAARGEDVACETTMDGVTIVLFATRFSFATSLDEQIRGVETAIRQRYPDAQAYAATREISSDTLPAHRTAAFFVSRNGARCFTSASVAQVGDWVIKLRYTAPAANEEAAEQAEAIAGRTFVAALADIVDARTPQP